MQKADWEELDQMLFVLSLSGKFAHVASNGQSSNHLISKCRLSQGILLTLHESQVNVCPIVIMYHQESVLSMRQTKTGAQASVVSAQTGVDSVVGGYTLPARSDFESCRVNVN